jgi:outer membrane protein OmpA-like peptidoglycan-associated protein
VDEQKKRRRRRGIVGWVVGLSCLVAVGVVGAVVPMAVRQADGGGEAPGHAHAPVPDWVGPLEERVKRQGFEWLNLGFANRIVTVNGDAPDQSAAERAFSAAERAINTLPDADGAFDFVVDNIQVAGVAGVGAAFAALGPNPDVAACQTAFTDTLAGRFVGFRSGAADVTPESARLLDALSAVAKACEAHRIEIGGHTDMDGSASRNILLSESRAIAVRAYLVGRGVAEAQLSAVGYGEDRPLVAEQTPEANARNRRIEFTVTGF